jgi:sugar transferase (PEP-CTERM system associated)
MSRTYRLFNRNWFLPSAMCLAVDVALLVLSLRMSYSVRFYFGTPFYNSSFWIRAIAFAVPIVIALYLNGLYDLKYRSERPAQLMSMCRAFALAVLALWAVYYMTYDWLTPGRGVLGIALALSFGSIATWRMTLPWLLARQQFAERILIVGSDNAAIEIARELLRRKHLGLCIVGFVSDDPAVQGKSLINPTVLGSVDRVAELAREHRVHRVVVGQQERRGKFNLDGLLRCKTSGVPVEEGMEYYEKLTGKIMLESLNLRSQLIFSKGFVVSRGTLAVKRLGDILLAAIGLLLAAPIMLLVGIVVRLDSPGPIFFRQPRVGRFGREFTILKFRSMRADAEADGSPRWAQPDDPRVTRLGQWIRKARLDELPQLWSVLKGDMSLVGPRPERELFVEELSTLSPLYGQRLVVRPGLTGWAQIQAPYASSVEESLEKLKYDLYYIKNLSFALDMTILASTARTVLLGRGAR